MLNWKCSREDLEMMSKIADRAVKMAKRLDIMYDKRHALMDLIACHCNGCPLNLEQLNNAPNGDFGHDVFGILANINRETGALENCFLPRCALLYTTADKMDAMGLDATDGRGNLL